MKFFSSATGPHELIGTRQLSAIAPCNLGNKCCGKVDLQQSKRCFGIGGLRLCGLRLVGSNVMCRLAGFLHARGKPTTVRAAAMSGSGVLTCAPGDQAASEESVQRLAGAAARNARGAIGALAT